MIATSTPWRTAAFLVCAFAALPHLAAPLALEEHASAIEERALALEAREPKLEILRPRSGDVVVAEDRRAVFNITWTNNTLDFNASISVRQGPPDDLQKLATINGTVLSPPTITTPFLAPLIFLPLYPCAPAVFFFLLFLPPLCFPFLPLLRRDIERS
ncbi:MAG: hypothetical protein Q9217_006241 [Psora testacea]